ncbi:MAG: hypothetical protein ACAI44_20750, partial [Candidatus Sericytochromatia bacterium]
MQIKALLLTVLILGSTSLQAQSEGKQLTAATVVRPDGRIVSLGTAALAQFQQGIKARSSGNFQPAISAFTEAIRIYPAYAQAYYERGNTFLKL